MENENQGHCRVLTSGIDSLVSSFSPKNKTR